METAPDQPQTVLVVEDDILIRIDIADFLRDCGWHVAEAGTAAEAVALLESGAPGGLGFSAIQNPGPMAGFGLPPWLRKHRPGIRIILTSGVIQKTEAAASLCDEGPIGKPYDHQRLAERIRHHLGAAAGGPAGA